jgi:putative transposase
MAVSDAKRLKALEEENRRLKQLLAETMLDNQALKGVIVTTVQKVTVRQAVVMACLSGFTVDLSH